MQIIANTHGNLVNKYFIIAKSHNVLQNIYKHFADLKRNAEEKKMIYNCINLDRIEQN